MEWDLTVKISGINHVERIWQEMIDDLSFNTLQYQSTTLLLIIHFKHLKPRIIMSGSHIIPSPSSHTNASDHRRRTHAPSLQQQQPFNVLIGTNFPNCALLQFTLEVRNSHLLSGRDFSLHLPYNEFRSCHWYATFVSPVRFFDFLGITQCWGSVIHLWIFSAQSQGCWEYLGVRGYRIWG